MLNKHVCQVIILADNLNYNSLISDIECGRIKKLYLFYGPENMLISDAISRIKGRLLSPQLESLNFVKLDGSSIDYDTLINACETLPFMDERKIVEVEGCPFFKAQKNERGGSDDIGMGDIIEYLGRIPDTTVLILLTGGEIDKRRKIYNAVKKNGDIVEFGLLKGRELVSYIAGVFKRSGKSISQADALYLSERISGNLENVQNEINRLLAYAEGKTQITRQDIDTVVRKSLEMNIFQLVDSVVQKSPGSALVILNELLLDGEPIPVILTMIARQYRLLLNARLLSNKGYSRAEISKKLSLSPYIASKIIQLSGKYSEEQIEYRLKRCLDTDISIKTGTMDQRTAIEMLIVEFAKQ